MSMEIKMRRARLEDAAAIRNIDAATGGIFGLEIGQRPEEYYRDWLCYHRANKRCPVFVGTSEGRVIWWVALGESPGGYPFDGVATVETGIPEDLAGTELTDLLLRFLEQQAVKLGYYKLMAFLESSQRYLLHTYRRVGFRDVGVLRSHGYRKGKLVDLVILERLLTADMKGLEEYYRQRYDFYDDYFREERRRQSEAESGNYALEYEEVETPEDQLPEGIVRFLRTKRTPDGQPVRRRLDPEPENTPGEELPPPPPAQPQLPEGIIRFLRSKKNPDGSFVDPELPPVVPVKIPASPHPGLSPQAQPAGIPGEEAPAPGLGVVTDTGDEELDGQLQFNDV